jgi:glycerophosphoryl diester phosphodiesterase
MTRAPGVLVIAHRGASHELPENTPEAFERAIELGADFVEFDVHAAPDGSLVVCHGAPTGGEPRLEDVVDQCSGRIGLMCELKSPWRYRRHDVVARTVGLLPEDAVIVSFEPQALRQVQGLRTMQHVGLGVSIHQAARFAWAAGFWEPRAGRRGLALASRLGLRTAVYTVNDKRRMRNLLELGVDGIFTDRPELLLALVRG